MLLTRWLPVLLLLTACGAAPASDDEPAPDDTSSGPSAPALPEAVTRVEVGGRPIGLAAQGDDVLVALAETGRLARVGLRPRAEVLEETAIGEIPLRVVTRARTTWVSAFGEGAVVRLEDGRAQRWTGIAAEPEGMALRAGQLWVVDQAGGEALALNPDDGSVQRRVPVGAQPRLAASGESGLWVSSYGDSTLTRITSRGVRTTQRLCGGPQGLAETRGLVWVACTDTEEVVAVDAESLRERQRLAEVDTPHAVVPLPDGRVLVVSAVGPTLLTVEADGTLAATCALGELPRVIDGNVDATLVGDTVVVSSPLDGALLLVPLDVATQGC